MKKPIKPEKKIVCELSRDFYFDHVSNKVSLDAFLAWIKETVPFGAIDITLSLDEEYDYYDGGIASCQIQLGWKKIIDNPNYEKEIKKYNKKLSKWMKD